MQNLFAIQYSYLIPLLPLVGAAIAGFFGARWLRQQSHWPIWIGVGISAILSLSLLAGMLRLWHEEPHTEVTNVTKVAHDNGTFGVVTEYQDVTPALHH